jgi:uncharacterized protein (DUF1684 family)
MPPILPVLLLLAAAADPYVASIEAWRNARAERLRAEDGWLTVVGLHWLEKNRSTIGSADASDIVLPPTVPASAGEIVIGGEKVEFVAAKGVAATSDGKPVQRVTLESDTVGVQIGSVTFHLIERASRRGIRVRDKAAEARRAFKGLSWYPIDPQWRVQARLEPPPKGRTIRIATIVGDEIDLESAGTLVFPAQGRELRMEAVFDSADRRELFVMFKDRTNGEATYGAGRYMYLPVPAGSTLEIDFNKAYNPPCAYTDFATCPLPPGQNWLPVPIPAGEKDYKSAH